MRKVLFTLFVITGLYASPSTEQTIEKGNDLVHQMDALLSQYPHPLALREKISLLHTNWEQATAEYKISSGPQRREAARLVSESYRQLVVSSEGISVSMRTIATDVLADLNSTISDQQKDGVFPEKDKYVPALEIARRDIYRAAEATRRGQHMYAALLYDESIAVLKRTYSTLAYPMPPVLSEASGVVP